LADDGAIFISIDDNKIYNLKLNKKDGVNRKFILEF